MNSKGKEFQALQKKWYKKLKQDGFEDCEQTDGHLKLWSGHYFKSKFKHPGDLEFQKAKQDYYRRASQFLHEYKFPDPRTRRIWELHADGVSIRAIVETLKKEGYRAYKDVVHAVIKELCKSMKERPSE